MSWVVSSAPNGRNTSVITERRRETGDDITGALFMKSISNIGDDDRAEQASGTEGGTSGDARRETRDLIPVIWSFPRW